MPINELNVKIKGSGKVNKAIAAPPSDTSTVIFGANVSKPHVNQPKPVVNKPKHISNLRYIEADSIPPIYVDKWEGRSQNALLETADKDHVEYVEALASDHNGFVSEDVHEPDAPAVSTDSPDISIVEHSE